MPALRPAPGEELLLHAALGEGDEALGAFQRWRATTDFDRIGNDSMRLLPLVVDNLGPRLGDDDIAGRARGMAKYTWAHIQRAQHVMTPVLRELDEDGATAMLLKGWAFPDSYGGRGWLRARHDLDLLVPQTRFEAATTLLEDRGLSREYDVLHGDPRLGYRHAVSFSGPGGLQVDLHRRALLSIDQPDAEQPFWDAARPMTMQGARCLVPAPADLLLMVIEHAWHRNPLDSGGRWVADAVVLLRGEEALDWDRLVAMSERYWLAALVDDALAYLRKEYGAPYPDEVRRMLSRAPRWTRIERPARVRAPAARSRSERASLWLGDAVRSSVAPGSRITPGALWRAAAARTHVRRPAFLPVEALYRASGRPVRLLPMRRRWRRAPAAPACGRLPLGEPLPLAVGSPWLSVLGEGWSLPERTGVWSDGPEATLNLTLPPADGPLVVELDLSPCAAPGDERRLVDAVLADRSQRFELSAGDRIRLGVDPGPGPERLELSLLIRNPADPIEHGVEDTRRLGVHLRSLLVGAAGSEAESAQVRPRRRSMMSFRARA
jgi:hypothetical protein